MSEYFKSQQGMVFGPDLKTPFGRFAWVNLSTKKPGGEYNGKKADDFFDCNLLIVKDKKAELFIEELTGHKDGMVKEYNSTAKAKIMVEEVIQDGDTMDLDKYPFYANTWVIYGKNTKDVSVVDRDGKPYEASLIKGGNRGRFQVQIHLGGYGFRFKLKAVQFTSDDGVSFGGGVRSAASLLTAAGADADDAEAESTVVDLDKKPAEKALKGKAAAFSMA